MKQVNDERIINVRQRIGSQSFAITSILLMASVLVKTYALNLPAREYLTESLILSVSLIYFAARLAANGIFSMEGKMQAGKRKRIIWGIAAIIFVFGMAITVTNLIRSEARLAPLHIILVGIGTAALPAAITLAAYKAFSFISLKRQTKDLNDYGDE